MIRVLICDDQEVVRKGLQIILTHTEGMEVIGIGTNGEEGVQLALRHKPDVIMMDLKMPIMNGIHATKRITQALPQSKVIVLTTYDGDDWVLDAIRAGASGYLLKDADSEDIVSAIQQVVSGQVHLDPQVAGKILTEFNRLDQQTQPTSDPPNPVDPLLEELTPRELSILQLMVQGKNNKEIAEELHLAAGTIKNNVSNIMGKLEVSDRTQAVIMALKRGLVSLE